MEATIRSVFDQTYNNIEYIIIDGGSSDGSPDIIRKYESRLAYWQSRKDRGAGDAINQGWKIATGSIYAYLNSDDLLMPDAVRVAVDTFLAQPGAGVVYGDSVFIDAQGEKLGAHPSQPFAHAKVFTTWENPIVQPSCFFRRKVFEKFGGLDESYHFSLDFEYWLRICEAVQFVHIPVSLSAVRLHPAAKTWKLEAVQGRDLLRLGLNLVANGTPMRHGVQEEDARKGVYLRAANHLRNAGKRAEAIKIFWSYCRIAMPFPFALLRWVKFSGGVFLKDTFTKKQSPVNSIPTPLH